MHLFEGKMGILRLKNGLVFELMPYLAAFYLGPTPKNLFGSVLPWSDPKNATFFHLTED